MTLQKSHRKSYDGDPEDLISVTFTSRHRRLSVLAFHGKEVFFSLSFSFFLEAPCKSFTRILDRALSKHR